MRIGELSRRTGASAKAIRLYESMHLLPPVTRRGAYREYADAHLQQVLLIRRAQALGIGLASMRVLRPGGAGIDWPAAAALLRERQRVLHTQLQRLQAQAADVGALLDELDDCREAGAAESGCLSA